MAGLPKEARRRLGRLGLVPYTGICPIELTLDHTGPLARTVTDVALCLEVIAGRDGLDPRQDQTPESLPRYN